jgi:hypothetical protein
MRVDTCIQLDSGEFKSPQKFWTSNILEVNNYLRDCLLEYESVVLFCRAPEESFSILNCLEADVLARVCLVCDLDFPDLQHSSAMVCRMEQAKHSSGSSRDLERFFVAAQEQVDLSLSAVVIIDQLPVLRQSRSGFKFSVDIGKLSATIKLAEKFGVHLFAPNLFLSRPEIAYSFLLLPTNYNLACGLKSYNFSSSIEYRNHLLQEAGLEVWSEREAVKSEGRRKVVAGVIASVITAGLGLIAGKRARAEATIEDIESILAGATDRGYQMLIAGTKAPSDIKP